MDAELHIGRIKYLTLENCQYSATLRFLAYLRDVPTYGCISGVEVCAHMSHIHTCQLIYINTSFGEMRIKSLVLLLCNKSVHRFA